MSLSLIFLRSPGGTPLRDKPKDCEVNDPATLIARALKKKFAAQHILRSPVAEKENQNHGSGEGFTPVGTPKLSRSL